jgi:hypothetical protein
VKVQADPGDDDIGLLSLLSSSFSYQSLQAAAATLAGHIYYAQGAPTQFCGLRVDSADRILGLQPRRRERHLASGRVVQLLRLALVNAALLATVITVLTFTSRWLGFSRADEIAIIFCGSKKSLARGLPMASALFAGHVGLGVIPVILFHQIQLMVGASRARRYAAREGGRLATARRASDRDLVRILEFAGTKVAQSRDFCCGGRDVFVLARCHISGGIDAPRTSSAHGQCLQQ